MRSVYLTASAVSAAVGVLVLWAGVWSLACDWQTGGLIPGWPFPREVNTVLMGLGLVAVAGVGLWLASCRRVSPADIPLPGGGVLDGDSDVSPWCGTDYARPVGENGPPPFDRAPPPLPTRSGLH